MRTFITAIPLFDSKMAVHEYWMLTRSADKLFGSADDFRGFGEALNTPGFDLVAKIGTEPFARDLPLFVEVNQFQLLMGIPANMKLDPNKFICVVDKNVPISGDVYLRLTELKKLGFKLAFSGLIDDIPGDILVNMFEYLILDCEDKYFDTYLNKARLLIFKLKLVFMNVPDAETYNRLGKLHGVLQNGEFYSKPITKGNSKLSPIKENLIQLFNQISNEDFELDQASDIIERDPSLSLSLLRFLNSNASGKHKKIDAMRNAVAILGQKEVRRWAMIAISVGLAEDRPGEITKLLLVRAKFAENLAIPYRIGVYKSSLFIAGLLSLIDVVLQKPMKEAIREVSLDERVRKALVDKRGDIYKVLDLIYAYERAEWDRVSINMIKNEVDAADIIDAFVNAMIWYKEVLEVVDDRDSDN